MRFMMLMIPAVYQGGATPPAGFVPDPTLVARMRRFNDEMAKSLRLLDLNGLHPLSTGARVAFHDGKPTITDGPFIEAKEVIGGFWLVEADSKAEVVKWAAKCPSENGDTIEIRQVFGPEDLRCAT